MITRDEAIYIVNRSVPIGEAIIREATRRAERGEDFNEAATDERIWHINTLMKRSK